MGYSRDEVAALIDHTLLKPEASVAEVRDLVSEAKSLGAHSVCVSPSMLPLPDDIVLGRLKLAAVCGFPSGAHHSEVKAAEAARSVAEGADEVDMVVNLAWEATGRFDRVEEDIRAVREAVETPLLRKDFMVHPYQFYEARVHGADLVLLIAAALSDVELRAFLDLTDALGMTALVETHTEEEVERAVNAGVEVIGINNRDLKTLEVDLDRFGKLVSLIPDDRVKIAESGILSIDDARRVRQEGADAILVGEALVRHGDPRAAVEEFASID